MGMPLRPGDRTRLGGYELVGRLGEGGMGTVYLGRDPDGRKVAIKMVRSDFAYDSEFRGRFRSEVNRARQVPPFCTAEVLDADPDHDPPYLVVEYVDGPSLAATVRDNGPLSGAALHGVAVGIATALAAIHSAEVIHRDLKPSNVLVAPGGIKVIDFGIARAFEATSQHTRTDYMVGTVAYMAPERFDPELRRPITSAADVFAWGAVVAYAATGRSPFGADSATATAMCILTQEPDLAGLPASLRYPVERALSKDPEDRPTARELLDMLVVGDTTPPGRVAGVGRRAPVPGSAPRTGSPPPRDSAGNKSIGIRPSGRGTGPAAPARPRRHRWDAPVAVAALATAAVLFGAVVLVVRDRQAPKAAEATPPLAVASRSDSVATPEAKPSPSDTYASILRGQRRTLIHVVEINRDLALDTHSAEVTASDGTGAKSLFVLVPYGVDYLIRTLRDGSGTGETCVGVKIIPGGASSLAPTQCSPTQATVFSLTPTGRKDDKGRPTYHMYNQAYGFVQYSSTRRVVYVEEVGDAEPMSSFSFIDRGPL